MLGLLLQGLSPLFPRAVKLEIHPKFTRSPQPPSLTAALRSPVSDFPPGRRMNSDNAVKMDFDAGTHLASGLRAVSLSEEVGAPKCLAKGSSVAGGLPLLGIVSIVTASVLSGQ